MRRVWKLQIRNDANVEWNSLLFLFFKVFTKIYQCGSKKGEEMNLRQKLVTGGVILLMLVGSIIVINSLQMQLNNLCLKIYGVADFVSDNLEKNTAPIVDINYLIHSSVFVKTPNGLGSGTVIAKTKDATYILTCWHVIRELLNQTKEPKIGAAIGYNLYNDLDSNNGTVMYGAFIIKFDETVDLALLKINFIDDKMTVASIAKWEPKIGETVYSVGNPLGILRTVSRGILSNYQQDLYYVSDNMTTFGNSGGGLFNNRGELIGVPSQIPIYPAFGSNGIPAAGLGFSINLIAIRNFLIDIDLTK